MRQIIRTTLENVKNILLSEESHPDIQEPIIGVDYEYTLSESQKYRLQKLHDSTSKIVTCLSAIEGLQNVHYGSTSSVCGSINGVENASFVLEFSLYAPFIAVFIYGNVPSIIVQCVQQCIHELNFIQIQQDEIQELEQEGLWHVLF